MGVGAERGKPLAAGGEQRDFFQIWRRPRHECTGAGDIDLAAGVELAAGADRAAGARLITGGVQRGDKFGKGLFDLTANYGVGLVFEQVVRVQAGVETIEADMAVRVDRPHPSGRLDPEAQGSVHRDADSGEQRSGRFFRRERLDRQIECGGHVSGPPQESERRGQRDGLAAQLVA